jgi:peptidoglycan/LPS O-acetylase OafA/YrhL
VAEAGAPGAVVQILDAGPANQLAFGEGTHLPALDGVRGLAICLVLAAHFRILPRSVAIVRGLDSVQFLGYTGVDLFFVLSGFLITGILLDARRATPHYFRNFYARRALRILPLYYGAVAVLVLILPLFHRHTLPLQVLQRNQWWYWLHATNVLSATGDPSSTTRGTSGPWRSKSSSISCGRWSCG